MEGWLWHAQLPCCKPHAHVIGIQWHAHVNWCICPARFSRRLRSLGCMEQGTARVVEGCLGAPGAHRCCRSPLRMSPHGDLQYEHNGPTFGESASWGRALIAPSGKDSCFESRVGDHARLRLSSQSAVNHIPQVGLRIHARHVLVIPVLRIRVISKECQGISPKSFAIVSACGRWCSIQHGVLAVAVASLAAYGLCMVTRVCM